MFQDRSEEEDLKRNHSPLLFRGDEHLIGVVDRKKETANDDDDDENTTKSETKRQHNKTDSDSTTRENEVLVSTGLVDRKAPKKRVRFTTGGEEDEEEDAASNITDRNVSMTHEDYDFTHQEAKVGTHRPVERRPPIARELLGQKGSSAANPDSRDMLRRVSILVAQHILSGERIRHRSRAALRRPSSAKEGARYVAVPSNARNRLAERWKVSQQFSEEHFVKPQRRHYLDVLPGLRMLTCFHMVNVRPQYRHPSHETIFTFIERLFKRARLDPGCSIICLIYVERLMNRTGLYLLRRNWRPIMLVSMLIASKMWQDLGCWNAEFSRIYPQFCCKSITKLERLFIAKLQWNTIISSGFYSKYYFALRSLNEKKKFRSKYLNMVGVRPSLPQANRIAIASKKKAMVLSRSM